MNKAITEGIIADPQINRCGIVVASNEAPDSATLNEPIAPSVPANTLAVVDAAALLPNAAAKKVIPALMPVSRDGSAIRMLVASAA